MRLGRRGCGMSEVRHTKGPWHRNIAPAAKYSTIFAGRNEHVAAIHHAKTGDEAEANHNLMVAAPELLEALENVVAAYQAHFDVMPVAWQTVDDMARAAIARARGEPCKT